HRSWARCCAGARPESPSMLWTRRPRKADGSRPAPRARPRLFRAEAFGAIVQLERPRALVFVDRDYARSLGHAESTDADVRARWTHAGDDGQIGARPLAAPLEAHLQLTNRCDAGCT